MAQKVILIGDDGANTVGVLRSLGEKGYQPDLIITHNSAKPITIKKSKYYNQCRIVDKSAELVLAELEHFACPNEKVFIIPTSDFILKILSENKDYLEEKFIFPTVSEKCVSLENVMSKTVMAEYAKQVGFSIPKMIKYSVTEESTNDDNLLYAFRDLYPLILKADSIFIPGCDFFIVKNEEELKEKLQICIGLTIIIQQYIDEAEEVAIQGVSLRDKAQIFGVIHKIRTSLFALGTTSYAELREVDDRELQKKSEDFATLIGLNGIYDLDVLIKEGKHYFIECNFRNGSNGYAYTKMGANLPYIWLYGEKNGEFPVVNLHNVVFCNDVGDFAHVLHRKINPFKWVWQYLTADAHLVFNIKDMGPFWAEINLGRIKKLFKK